MEETWFGDSAPGSRPRVYVDERWQKDNHYGAGPKSSRAPDTPGWSFSGRLHQPACRLHHSIKKRSHRSAICRVEPRYQHAPKPVAYGNCYRNASIAETRDRSIANRAQDPTRAISFNSFPRAGAGRAVNPRDRAVGRYRPKVFQVIQWIGGAHQRY